MPADVRSKREPYTPAYALTGAARRAIDLIYQKAESLRNALPVNVGVQTKAIVPFNSKYVSGLNTPTNLAICVGSQAIDKHKTIQRRAIRALEKRNV